MENKYYDTTASIQVIGCVFNKPSLLESEDKYMFTEEDFCDDLHKVVFGTIVKLHQLGVDEITLNSISDFLATRKKSEAIYEENHGREFLMKVSDESTLSTFDYYYNRVKKMTLLRAYDNFGLDLTWLYDDNNFFDPQKKQAQEDWLDNTSLQGIGQLIDDKIEEIKCTYINEAAGETREAGEGINDLIEKFKKTPEAGIPLFGPLINTVTRGARLKKFYLRSAATGVGKTRTLIADACNFACDKIYYNGYGWINNGLKEPTIFITTELELEEVQTMMLAFLSNVDEEHILTGTYQEGEEERVFEASEILSNSPLFVRELPDFSLLDIENTIKKEIREKDIRYVCFDYIHTSLKILEEITRRSGGVKLREDNILFMVSIKLKDLCNQYGVFIISATQLNGDYKNSSAPDQNLLRGAKAIADKVDVGMILMDVTNEDLAGLDGLIRGGLEVPTTKMSIYKNRRGKYKSVLLWCRTDLGTCRIEPLFATNFRYVQIPINDLSIEVESAF